MTTETSSTATTTGATSVVGKPDAETGIYRHGFGLKSQVQGEISGDYQSAVVDRIRAADYSLKIGALEVHLAREFGFCYGVEKAVDYAYQTRRMFPERRIFLTTEIIHNPRVNRRLLDMGIGFLSGQYKGEIGFDEVSTDDVVLLPAFGAAMREIDQLRSRGCTVVDTTCGSVIHVWKRVERYARERYTSVIHGKYSHEETIATSSRVSHIAGGRYVVVRDRDQAELVCGYIRGERAAEELRRVFEPHAWSEGFDPATDLLRVGVANQTTMLSSESLEIAGMLKQSMIARYGEAAIGEHFRSFDTICSATQERQDAVQAFASAALDLILVVGGFNSSNTTHLIEIASNFTRAFHIEDVSNVVSASELVHKRWNSKETEVAHDWLPSLPLRLGITAGASTPNRAIGEVVQRIAELCGVQHELLEIISAGQEQALAPVAAATGCPTVRV